MARMANLDGWRGGAFLGLAALTVGCGGSEGGSRANADSGFPADAATGGASTAGSGGAGVGGRAPGAGGASAGGTSSGTGGTQGAGGVSTGPCGGASCGPGQACCGPPECGRCVPATSGAFCPDYCEHCSGRYQSYRGAPSCPSERPVLWEANVAELTPFFAPACQDAGTGIPRYCCSADFEPVCP